MSILLHSFQVPLDKEQHALFYASNTDYGVPWQLYRQK